MFSRFLRDPACTCIIITITRTPPTPPPPRYRFLDSNIGVRNPTAPRVIATKVGLDQLLFTPLSTFMFYAYLCSAEGRPSAYLNTIRDKYWATNIAGWKLYVYNRGVYGG